MRLTGLDRQVLELARDGVVLEEPDAVAVAEAYRRLNREGLLEAAWWRDGVLPLEVAITPAGRMLLRSRGTA
ncbi:hypothetical protein [Kineococcus sp. SYSU DK002]|uniref:hypothetical protein n=1 Tax=Kineococcus sp. SYSU DK002 TaxID=3383123 RepID=UPI003D7E26B4